MPQPKKTQRPRLDAIKRHILAGSFDDELWEIKGAIEERNRRRQETVEKLVREVYGDGFKVVPAAQQRQPAEVLPGESPHVLDPNASDVPSAPTSADDEDLGDGYESRSPIIGSMTADDAPDVS